MYTSWHHRGRRLFFWTLVVLYSIIVSIAIPYAFGYRFSIQRGVFIYAGAITIKSNPSDVTIAIDGVQRFATEINDTLTVNGIAPGEHTVTITRDGFQPWRKRVRVTSGTSTEFWNVILPRMNYPRTLIANLPHPARALFVSPNARRAVIATDTDTVTVLPLERSATVHTISLPTGARIHEHTNIEWSPDSTLLLIPIVSADGQSDILIAHADTGRTVSIRTLFPNSHHIVQPRWDAKSPRTLYARIDSVLQRISLNSEQLSDLVSARSHIVAQHVATYTITNGVVYIVDKRTGIIHRIMPDGTTRAISSTQLNLGTDAVTLTVYDESRFTIRTHQDGILYLSSDDDSHSLRQLARGIVRSHFSDDGKKLLYTTHNTVFITFIRDWTVQPLRRAGTTLTVARFSTPITDAQWAQDYEHVLLSGTHTIKLISADHRGGHTTSTLIKTNQNTVRFHADHSTNRIIVADGTEVFFIKFPEKTTVLR